MALMDIEDLNAAFTSVARVLRPGGWLGFSVFHPCFNTPLSGEIVDDAGRAYHTVTGYFTEGYWKSDLRLGPPGKIEAYHRTLATFLNGLIQAGLDLASVSARPPLPTREVADALPCDRADQLEQRQATDRSPAMCPHPTSRHTNRRSGHNSRQDG